MLGKVVMALVVALGSPAVAGCLGEGQVPQTIDFGEGQVVRNISVRDGLLIYETEAGGQPTHSEVRLGLYPEVMRRGDKENRFDWSGQDLIRAAELPLGEEVEVRAKMSGNASGQYVLALKNLGLESFTVGDCTYQAIHLKIRQGEADAPEMLGDRWVDPVRLITFRHIFTMLDEEGKPTRTFGTKLRSME